MIPTLSMHSSGNLWWVKYKSPYRVLCIEMLKNALHLYPPLPHQIMVFYFLSTTSVPVGKKSDYFLFVEEEVESHKVLQNSGSCNYNLFILPGGIKSSVRGLP